MARNTRPPSSGKARKHVEDGHQDVDVSRPTTRRREVVPLPSRLTPTRRRTRCERCDRSGDRDRQLLPRRTALALDQRLATEEVERHGLHAHAKPSGDEDVGQLVDEDRRIQREHERRREHVGVGVRSVVEPWARTARPARRPSARIDGLTSRSTPPTCPSRQVPAGAAAGGEELTGPTYRHAAWFPLPSVLPSSLQTWTHRSLRFTTTPPR